MIPNPLHLCPSVKSVVENLLTTDGTDEHRFLGDGMHTSISMNHTSSKLFQPRISPNPLHLCPSVKSVVKNLSTTDGTDEHRFFGGRVGLMFGQGGLGEMHQLFGEQMDSVIEELNGGLVA